MAKLAILGGEPTIKEPAPTELFKWPIITQEDEDAALDVIRNNSFSGTQIAKQFEAEFAEWIGRDYALTFCNGTMSLTAAMFAAGLGMGDEIICTTKTYWASITQAVNFGATPVFCNIKDDMTMDPDDLERCISPKTKAIMVVHYLAKPCDMDKIMAIAKKHDLIVIEDVSHAQGGKYKGKRLGTFGDVAAMSLMSTKSFSAGELGVLVTNNKKYYERAIAFAHYDRNNDKNITDSEDLKPYFNIALGGCKGRANQLCCAIARVQLKYYDARCEEIRRAVNYFFDLLEGLPGIKPIRVDEADGSNMAGWYIPHFTYKPEELGGLSANRFARAVKAEGYAGCSSGANYCLHRHEFFKSGNLYNTDKPSRVAFTERDTRTLDDDCAPSVEKQCVSAPWFKHFDKEWIEKYAEAYKKVVMNYTELLDDDADKSEGGRWHGAYNT